MAREAVDVVFPQPPAPEHLAWLHATRVPLRSIHFRWSPPPKATRFRFRSAQALAASTIATSADIMAASTGTLKVPPSHTQLLHISLAIQDPAHCSKHLSPVANTLLGTKSAMARRVTVIRNLEGRACRRHATCSFRKPRDM